MHRQIIEQLAALITTAFGLVAALAWNTAIQEWFKAQDSLRAGGPWLYAILVTVIAVLATVWIAKVAERVAPKEVAEEA